jgi:hypothetical protein
MNRALLFAVPILFTLGCAAHESASIRPIHAARVAVLPAANETQHPEGALLVRDLVTRWLSSRGYVTVPQDQVDRALQTAGFADPARPPTAQLQRLARDTGAEALAAIDLLDFTSVNRGFSSERRVAIAVRLLDPASGNILWQNTDQVVNASSTKNPTRAVMDYVRGWGTEAYEKAMQSPLFGETNALVERLLQDLPVFSPA